MAGNVWEWIHDWWDGSYYGISPGNNPPGPATGTYKVLARRRLGQLRQRSQGGEPQQNQCGESDQRHRVSVCGRSRPMIFWFLDC